MESGEQQAAANNWYSDSDSDDSIVVTINQMKVDLQGLESTLVETRNQLDNVVKVLDSVEESDDIQEDKPVSSSPSLEPVAEADEKPEDASDDRFRDAEMSAGAGDGEDESPPYDASDLLEGLLDAVMNAERQRDRGAGDMASSVPLRRSKSDPQAKEGSEPVDTLYVGDGNDNVSATCCGDSDDADVVVSVGPWEVPLGSEGRRLHCSLQSVLDGGDSPEASCVSAEGSDDRGLPLLTTSVSETLN